MKQESDNGESPPKGIDGAIHRAGQLIQAGGVVAFPTETFYGLAVDPFQPAALVRLSQLKERDPAKPFLLLIDSCSSLSRLTDRIPSRYDQLMDQFWPGPLTLIFQGIKGLPLAVTGRDGSVAVRLSSHPVARKIAAAAGGIITGTSANPSGVPPPVTASHVKALFPDGLAFTFAGGRTPGGAGSTIVALDGEALILIRAGEIPFADLAL
ncbi:MAG: threonylcarbamoyl-AMP synthase [Proteobacteria bacterium]|nr:threonylcarbamoyl-AMP synthase [Pseudomonadota bacterium]MBU1688240.1 threonylcarbamoyl-AMP synthase [Pseudomonadota bacterium]